MTALKALRGIFSCLEGLPHWKPAARRYCCTVYCVARPVDLTPTVPVFRHPPTFTIPPTPQIRLTHATFVYRIPYRIPYRIAGCWQTERLLSPTRAQQPASKLQRPQVYRAGAENGSSGFPLAAADGMDGVDGAAGGGDSRDETIHKLNKMLRARNGTVKVGCELRVLGRGLQVCTRGMGRVFARRQPLGCWPASTKKGISHFVYRACGLWLRIRKLSGCEIVRPANKHQVHQKIFLSRVEALGHIGKRACFFASGNLTLCCLVRCYRSSVRPAFEEKATGGNAHYRWQIFVIRREILSPTLKDFVEIRA